MMFQDALRLPAPGDKCSETFYSLDQAAIELKTAIENERLHIIQGYINRDIKGMRILEIGSGLGVLGNILKGKQAEYLGIEPSVYFYNSSIRNFPCLGGSIKNTYFEEARIDKGYFDVILMVDVLEHIPEPVGYIKNVRQYLRSGGILYIEIPNEDLLRLKGWIRRKLNFYFNYPTHPLHVSLFTRNTLSILLSNSGFRSALISQNSILGNKSRMKYLLKEKYSLFADILCNFFNFTKLDLILQQGNLIGMGLRDG
jgi:2-polyprenyl-3-methyl-5-hydroxy-6-metoxy-1,4-benzoquinol methylase